MSRPLRASAWCLAVLLAATAHSQETSSGPIEEIVVTATKRESSLQDTAIAISAFDQAALERQNIDDMLDVQFAVPNLSFTKTNFSASNLAIRGIGRSVVATSGDSGVGMRAVGPCSNRCICGVGRPLRRAPTTEPSPARRA